MKARVWVKFIAGRLLRVASTLVPKKDLMVFASFDGYAGNCRAFSQAVESAGFVAETTWLSLDSKQAASFAALGVPNAPMASLRGLWRLMRARWLVSTHGELGRFRSLRGQVYVNLWHGLPFKNGGYLMSPSEGNQLRENVQRCDVMPCSSPFSQAVAAGRFHIRADRLVVTGLPRNDPILDRTGSRARLEDMLGRPNAGRIVMYSPTHRQVPNGPLESSWTFDHFREEYLVNKLAEELWRRDILLVIKLHPYDEERALGDSWHLPENVRMLTRRMLEERGVDLYEILGGFDALWTDYSSVAVDYLLTKRAVFYFVDDMEEYFRSRGVMLGDFSLMAPGPQIRGIDSLIEALASWDSDPDYYRVEREAYVRRMHTAQPPFSENLINVLAERYP